MKVMVLTPYLPHREVGHGGGTAVRDLVTWLARRHEVLVVALLRPGEADRGAEVEELGVRVETVPFPDATARGRERVLVGVRRLVSALRSVFSGYPPYVQKYDSGDVVARVLAAADSFGPDAIQIEYLQLSLACRALRRRRDAAGTATPRLILNSHELGSVPRLRRAARAADPMNRALARLEAAAWVRLQRHASTWADTTLCVTEEDRRLYEAQGGINLQTVPLGMDTQALRADWSPREPERFLFVGSFGHRPNRLGAEFLLDRVWPRVAVSRPDARLSLAGRGSREFLAGRRIPGPGADRVEALGFVPDLTPLFRESRLFLAPLPEGGGIKIKILEAMARGIPVVTSPVGAEGIAAPEDNALLIAPCDESFATAVGSAAEDLATCAARATRARRLVESRYSWEKITERLTEIYGGN